jgi:hypothetical protein
MKGLIVLIILVALAIPPIILNLVSLYYRRK